MRKLIFTLLAFVFCEINRADVWSVRFLLIIFTAREIVYDYYVVELCIFSA